MGEISDIVTLTLTLQSLEQEIHNVWQHLKEKRSDDSIPPCLRDWEMSFLMDMNNRLDVEATNLEEKQLQVLLQSLRLEEIGAKSAIYGLEGQIRLENAGFIAVSEPFVDPLYADVPVPSPAPLERKG